MSTPTECTKLRVDHNVNHGVQVTITCQCRFISHNKYSIPVWDVYSQLCYTGTGSIWENSVASTQFFCELKIALKKKFIQKRKIQSIKGCFAQLDTNLKFQENIIYQTHIKDLLTLTFTLKKVEKVVKNLPP